MTLGSRAAPTLGIEAIAAGTFCRAVSFAKDTAIDEANRLAALIGSERESLLAMWRARVRALASARHLDTPTLTDHLPEMLDELCGALHSSPGEGTALGPESTSPAHGLQRLRDGFDIAEVVAEYNILRACIHDLANAKGVKMQGKPFEIANLVLGEAVSMAVRTYVTQRDLEVRRRREEHLAFVAHDLRTPLSAVAVATRVLEQNLPGGGGALATRMVDTLKRNVRYLDELVASILKENIDFASDPGMRPERRAFELWPLVEGLLHELHSVATTAGIHLVNDVPDELAVFADAALLKRVFENLIANGLAHSQRGQITVGAREHAESVECWVMDDGQGIEEGLLARIFEKGTTTRPDGAGLGLAIVKSFVEAHGGTISVESARGAGSIFRFTLPRPERDERRRVPRAA